MTLTERARSALLSALVAMIPVGASADAGDLQGACATQIRTFVSERFGHSVRDIEFRWIEQKSRDSIWNLSQAVVFVEECPGFHYFEMNGDQFRCVRQQHLGEVPNYVLYRSSGGGC